VTGFEILFAAGDLLHLAVEVFLFLLKPPFGALQLVAALANLKLHVVAQAEDLFLTLVEGLSFDSFRLGTGVTDDPVGLAPGTIAQLTV
jgi:hypothetical protein